MSSTKRNYDWIHDPAVKYTIQRCKDDDILVLSGMMDADYAEAQRLAQASARQRLAIELKRAAGMDGTVAVQVGQMDCDLHYWTQLAEIEPTVEAWQTLYDDVVEHAECGEQHISMLIIDDDKVAEWESYSRDIAAERAGY